MRLWWQINTSLLLHFESLYLNIVIVCFLLILLFSLNTFFIRNVQMYVEDQLQKRSSENWMWPFVYNKLRTVQSGWALTKYKRYCYSSKHVWVKASQTPKYRPLTPSIVPTSHSAQSLWTEVPYLMVFWLTATPDISPQIAVNRHWHHIGVWL